LAACLPSSDDHDKKEVRTTMSMLFSRTAIIPVWLLVFGPLVLFGSPMTFPRGLMLLLAGGVALTIMRVLWQEPAPTIAAMTVPGPPPATLSSTDFASNSWPNSGFRNIRKRGTRGQMRK
jgi:hypothetical protein